ncbi:uncharacterized protein CEXT_471311 [Caerostris extrusa]|uniref:Uncharacterized protein n=1 Tax=Caerostris extrusa TaxID=172846 RepID=A0AAV4YE39_CAEEX|nr:uncharacterized protein CEXT_471311 [Caerostris extrusa]
MKIGLLLFLTTFWLSIDASVTYSVEDIMRSVLKKIMTCPNTPDAYASHRPVAAFSPARFMQLVALVRKDSGELACGRVREVPFQINDPRTWSFCNMGICLSEKLQGTKCSKFQGKCWLYYCFLIGCKFELPSLHCVCDPSLYGQIVTSKIYFYDHGIEDAYRPFPEDFVMIDVVEAPVIQETESGRRSKTSRSLDFEDGTFEEDSPNGEDGPVFSQSELTDDWEHSNQYMDENILPKSNTNSRAFIKPMEEFDEKQPKRAIRSELSTIRVLWSDSEIEDDPDFSLEIAGTGGTFP